MSLTIHTKNLIKRYSNRTVVNDVSIEVKQGEIVGLLGPNGAGKTTSFYMVVGLIKPDEGEVYLNELNITRMPMYKRAQMGIGYLPQEASIFRKLSVEDNVAAVLEMTKLTKKEQKIKLEELLSEFRLTHVRKNNGDSLSGGERRRTEIARALATDPKFILLDEPFAGVDPIAVEDIQQVIVKLVEKDLKPRDIVNKNSLINAFVLDMAMGGSTNTVLHTIAASVEAGIEFDLKELNNLSRKTPYLCKVSPAVPDVHMEDVFNAGGISVILRESSIRVQYNLDLFLLAF